jgi:hypothetical protein
MNRLGGRTFQGLPALFLKGFLLLLFAVAPFASHGIEETGTDDLFGICRLKYGGGGDWYGDPSSLPNLLRAVEKRLGIAAAPEEEVREPSDAAIVQFPFLYMTGHGNVHFDEDDVSNLRAYLEQGGFLWADDCYGMDESFRREIRKVFPDAKLEKLPADHPIFHCYYDLPEGLPAVHEHDPEKGPEAFAIHREGRIVVLYTYQSDIGDGLEDSDVHNDPAPIREAAAKMALNIVWYAMSH